MPKGRAVRLQARQQVARTWRRVLAAASLAASAAAPSVLAADVEFGRYLSSECMTCHGSAGKTGGIPDIAGMEETTFAEVVKAYRDKRMSNPVMQTVASRLKDDEIAALAAYFATVKPIK